MNIKDEIEKFGGLWTDGDDHTIMRALLDALHHEKMGWIKAAILYGTRMGIGVKLGTRMVQEMRPVTVSAATEELTRQLEQI